MDKTIRPGKGGKWFRTMSVGSGMLAYDSMLALTHFKGHMMGGFGGSNWNGSRNPPRLPLTILAKMLPTSMS